MCGMGREENFISSAHKRGFFLAFLLVVSAVLIIIGRLVYLMIVQADHYGVGAYEVQTRERTIKAQRGVIYDANGIAIADNEPVCTISVIHAQLKEPEKVIEVLSRELSLEEADVRKKVEKVSSREKIRSNVKKETADRIREYELDGVMVDEDYKRFYPYGSLASKVIGFTGADNQGILGLEVRYDAILSGTPGKILTVTTAQGVEVKNRPEGRLEPEKGSDLYISLDVNIQKYAQQLCERTMEQKNARSVRMIVMNPQNGEILSMVNVPEFDLNQPYELVSAGAFLTQKELSDALNEQWRNHCISDSYEPGSTFKIVTAVAAFEEGKVTTQDRFFCPGYKIVGDRKIRCHKTTGHGAETFREGIMNSCNPVFMEVGARVGAGPLLKNYRKLGLYDKTGIDLPGEANSIMHREENIKEVELATMSFGQSVQITPIQLLKAASMAVNGGKCITPHFGVRVVNPDGSEQELTYETDASQGISKETSEVMKELLEAVVAEGGGSRAAIEGYRIGGKTATSQKLPRSSHKYIASFIGFAPADDPQVIAMLLIDEPQGIYYGGTIAAPVVRELYENILPYLEIEENRARVEDAQK